MPTEIHPHHHPGHVHPPAAIALSILRMSAWHRLGAALVLIAVLWVAVYWTMS
jgi:hypothetical protein